MTQHNGQQMYLISQLIDQFLLYRQSKPSNRSYKVFHPSAFGKCLRKMQYQKYVSEGLMDAPVQSVEPRMIRIWDTGHTMHSRWSQYMEDLGVLRGVWKCANPLCKHVHGEEAKIGIFKPVKCERCDSSKFHYEEITIDHPELNFHGHCDQVLDFSNMDNEFKNSDQFKSLSSMIDFMPSSPIVVDMKTIGKNQWSKLEKGAHFYYIVQLTVYLHVLNLDMGIIIYERKDDSEIKMFKVTKNDEWWDVINKQAKLMLNMFEKKTLPPPRPTDKNDFDCKFCEFKDTCHDSNIWNSPNLDELRRKFYSFDNFD
jgi:hypothetical protein